MDVKAISKDLGEPQEWLKKREEALRQYESLPIPSYKSASWRYTKVDFDPKDFQPGKQKIGFTKTDDNIIFTDLKTALNEHRALLERHAPMSLVKIEDKFMAMHAAYANTGIVLFIPRNTHVEMPLKNIFTAQDGIFFNHSIIILDEGASLTYIEEHKSENDAFRSDAVEIYLKDNARLHFYSHQDWKHDVINISNWKAQLHRDAHITWVFGQFGGAFSRLKIDTEFIGEGADAKKYGVFYADKKQRFDITTDAIHRVPHTTCDILVKGVLDDHSRSVYRGMIKIDEDAQDTNSYLSDHSLILSNNAVSNSIPSLEIDANEVRASHGATLGKPDKEEIFYLRSRGLSQKEAMKLLILGYFADVTEQLEDASIRDKFDNSLHEKYGE